MSYRNRCAGRRSHKRRQKVERWAAAGDACDALSRAMLVAGLRAIGADRVADVYESLPAKLPRVSLLDDLGTFTYRPLERLASRA